MHGVELTPYNPEFARQMEAAERLMREDRARSVNSPSEPKMAEIVWLLEETVRAVHARQISEHGGKTGIRDEGLLLSAPARPQNLAACVDPPPDLTALAASYAYGIARNHPFIDGNKRVAHVAARTFLLINGADLEATQEEKYVTFLRPAEGGLSEDELAGWLRARIKR